MLNRLFQRSNMQQGEIISALKNIKELITSKGKLKYPKSLANGNQRKFAVTEIIKSKNFFIFLLLISQLVKYCIIARSTYYGMKF